MRKDKILDEFGQRPKSPKPPTDQELIHTLQGKGYRIVREDPIREAGQRAVKIQTISRQRWKDGKTLKFAVVSDSHFGSQCQQPTYLQAFYDRVVAEGIDTVFHGGDLFDGDGRVYHGQEFDLFLFGYDRQLAYGVENYPKRPGVTTYVIAGNHDWSFYQRGGADIVKALCEERKDLRYLGPMSGFVELGDTKIKVQLTHGKGGSAYAKSYRVQRQIENFAPEHKPELFFLGNFHSWCCVPMTRNVYGWQIGCFQSQTEFEKRLGLYPEVGGLIVEVSYGTQGADRTNGIVEVRGTVVPFFVPKAKDF